MKKKDIGLLIFAGALMILVIILAPIWLPGGRFSPWVNVILGLIAIPFVFPIIIRWIRKLRPERKSIAAGLTAGLIIWSFFFIAYLILVILGVAI